MRLLPVVLVVALAACSPAATSETEVELREFSISTSQRLTGGAQDLHVVNRGEFGHTLVVSSAATGSVSSAVGSMSSGASSLRSTAGSATSRAAASWSTCADSAAGSPFVAAGSASITAG